jgi:hypothetical protein
VSEVKSVSEVVSQLKQLSGDSASENEAIIAAFRNDLPRVLDFVEKSVEVADKAHELLANAYSTQDAAGIRIQSEDAVKLQWALRAVGVGDDSGEPCFTV